MSNLVRGKIEVLDLHSVPSDRTFWLSRTPDERLAAIEEIRRINFGYDESSQRLSRFLEVVERKRG